jgi:hypothetical protein
MGRGGREVGLTWVFAFAVAAGFFTAIRRVVEDLWLADD